MKMNQIIHGDCLKELKKLKANSVDLLCTDPPYGYSFMGKDWDKAVPSVEIWQECLRVLKPGAFAFVMSAPRQDVLSQMIVRIGQAGFDTNYTSIYWTYASGFPKALHVAKNIGKIADEVCKLFINASTAKKSSNDTPASTKAGVRIAVQGVEVSPKQLSFNVLVELPSASRKASTGKPKNITVPATALIEECERALSKIRGGVPSKTELGNPKFWRQVDFDALCAELIDGWKHIIFSKLETDPTFATTFQTECASATTVIITASTRERLISSTAATLVKKLGGEREVLSVKHKTPPATNNYGDYGTNYKVATTRGTSPLEGSYGGFQPKPAVEVVIVAMKPLSEKTFVDQALKNGKGITWLDDCRVPTSEKLATGFYPGEDAMGNAKGDSTQGQRQSVENTQGRFPANLLVSDDVLNDGRIVPPAGNKKNTAAHKPDTIFGNKASTLRDLYGDSGSYSRFFDLDAWARTVPSLQTRCPRCGSTNLATDPNFPDQYHCDNGCDYWFKGDAWAKTLPFLITPKASKGEKNEGLDGFEKKARGNLAMGMQNMPLDGSGRPTTRRQAAENNHPTVKPLKLMSYLITLGSRPGDVVLEPFAGSGTTCLAAKNLGRNYIGIEREAEYVKIAKARLKNAPPTQPTLIAAE